MLSVTWKPFMLSVVMLSVVMLIVVVPFLKSFLLIPLSILSLFAKCAKNYKY
jgi:hypothetical protein